MSDQASDELARALAAIGKDDDLRARFLDLCKLAEERFARPDFPVRDQITAPIIDALHSELGVLRKTLKDGTVFDFLYRSKIAREFVMSPDAAPDHVWEPQTTRLLLRLARDAAHVVIGGAYSGDQAILVARAIAGHRGTCHAFEPNDQQRAMLERNARNNHLTNIAVNATGLWRDERTELVLVGDDSFAHPEVADGGGGDSFPTESIDGYGMRNGLAHIDLVMLDIEGAEISALEGASRYLAQPPGEAPNVVFEVHRHYVDWSDGLARADIARLMQGFGYTLYAVRDFNSNVAMGDRPVELVPIETVYLDGPPHGFNMLATKDPELVKDSLFRIRPGVSPKLLWHRDPGLHHPQS